MLIHELAKAASASTHTIRYYEKEGLLDERHVSRQSNGYRVYNEAAVERLKSVQQARMAGFTMAEIKQLATLYDTGTLTPQKQRQFLQSKIQDLEAKIAALEIMKLAFTKKLKSFT